MINILVPDNLDGIGKCTKIYKDGVEIVEYKSILSIIRQLFYKQNKSLEITLANSSKLLNQKNLIPLYANHKEIYIPFKYKTPTVRKDPCYGYVRYGAIKTVTKGSIELIDGTKIACLDNARSLYKRFKMAEILIKAFSNLHQMTVIFDGEPVDFSNDEDKLVINYTTYLIDKLKGKAS